MLIKLRQVSLEIGVEGNISEKINSILEKAGLLFEKYYKSDENLLGKEETIVVEIEQK